MGILVTALEVGEGWEVELAVCSRDCSRGEGDGGASERRNGCIKGKGWFVNNKYPPNLYHLSYGVTMTFLLYLIFQNITFPGVVKKIIQFFSFNSYSIFFIHFLLIKILRDQFDIGKFGWLGFLFIILALTVVVQLFANKLRQFVSSWTT